MLPVARVTAEVFVVLPKVKDAIEFAADATARPTSRRAMVGVAVKPVVLKEVSSTVPAVSMTRPPVPVRL